MGLVRHKDYKTRSKTAFVNLKLHKQLMDERIAAGMNRAQASDEAFVVLMTIPFKKREGMLKQETNDQTLRS